MAEKTTTWLGTADEKFGTSGNWTNGVPVSVAASSEYDTVIFSEKAVRGCTADCDRLSDDSNKGFKAREIRIEKGFRHQIGQSGAPLKCAVLTKFANYGSGKLYWSHEKGASGSSNTLTRFIIDTDAPGESYISGNQAIFQSEFCNGTIAVALGSGAPKTQRIFIGANRANEKLWVTLKPPTEFNMVLMNGGLVDSYTFTNSSTSTSPCFTIRGGTWNQYRAIEQILTIPADIIVLGGRFNYRPEAIPSLAPNAHLLGGTLDASEHENVVLSAVRRSEHANWVPGPSTSATVTVIGR